MDIGRLVDIGEEIETAILTTIDRGWDEARRDGRIASEMLEVPMTERLREGMRNVLDSGALPWDGLIVARGTESMSRPGLSRPDGVSDIPIVVIKLFLEARDHDAHAIIECKRVAQGSRRLVKAYVDQGIDRFRDSKYGRNHLVGFMVGYLIKGGATETVAEINGIIQDYGRSDELLANVAQSHRWASSHPRSTGDRVRLHHTVVSAQAAS